MERRKAERLSFRSDASIYIGEKSYAGAIENVSEDGVEYLVTSSIQIAEDLTPEKLIELDFQSPSGNNIRLKCEVKWFLRTPGGERTLTMGMKILDPPAEYREMINKINKVRG